MRGPRMRQRMARAARECNLNVAELLAGVHACNARQIRTDAVDPGQDNGDIVDVEPPGRAGETARTPQSPGIGTAPVPKKE